MKFKFKKGDRVILRATEEELQNISANGVPNKIYYIHNIYSSPNFGLLYDLIDLEDNYYNYHKADWLHHIPIIKCELV